MRYIHANPYVNDWIKRQNAVQFLCSIALVWCNLRKPVKQEVLSPTDLTADGKGFQQMKLIVDTGTAISIILKSYLTGAVIHPRNISIISANRQQIDCSGQAMVNVILHNLTCEFTGTFVGCGNYNDFVRLIILDWLTSAPIINSSNG